MICLYFLLQFIKLHSYYMKQKLLNINLIQVPTFLVLLLINTPVMKGLSSIIILLISFCTYAQTVINFTHQQPEALVVNPYADQAILFPESIVLNANPAVSGGTEPYNFSWEPATGLDNPESANPIASPVETTTYTFTVNDNNGCSASNTFSIIVEMPQGLHITEIKSGKLYPNPAANTCVIEWHESEPPIINIYDMNGKLVLTPILPHQLQSEEIAIDIQKLKRGNYLVKAYNDNVLVNYRLVIN
jgi:hypothetical protein